MTDEPPESEAEGLHRAMTGFIQAMVAAVERGDPYTSGHQKRVAGVAEAMALELGLPSETVEGIRVASSIHDIGKIFIPGDILSKPSRIDEFERSLINDHAHVGYDLLRDIKLPWPIAEIVYQHHERMDGSGYPRHLAGEDIMLEARILAVADVVEAVTSPRPYRPALGLDAALEEISKNRGLLYDARVVDACLKIFSEGKFRFE